LAGQRVLPVARAYGVARIIDVSHAQPGDLICVEGRQRGSHVALDLYRELVISSLDGGELL
jgi:hypothetical protein